MLGEGEGLKLGDGLGEGLALGERVGVGVVLGLIEGFGVVLVAGFTEAFAEGEGEGVSVGVGAGVSEGDGDGDAVSPRTDSLAGKKIDLKKKPEPIRINNRIAERKSVGREGLLKAIFCIIHLT